MGEETDIAEPMSTEDVIAAEGVTADEPSKEHRRKRKKLLYKSLRDLIEFYMGDVNLSKDRFMSERIHSQPFVYIDLSLFLTFNKVRALTQNVEDLAKALSQSDILQVSEDGKQVCRKTPILKKENEDECTIYVEQLPPDMDHDTMIKMFSEYGTVDYVSLPRFSHSSKIKGFAFVEFKEPESAKRAIEVFKMKGCCLSPQMAPQDLMSIKIFDKNKETKMEKGKCEYDRATSNYKTSFNEKDPEKAHKEDTFLEPKDSSCIKVVEENATVVKEKKKRKCSDTFDKISKKIKTHQSKEDESSNSKETIECMEEGEKTKEKSADVCNEENETSVDLHLENKNVIRKSKGKKTEKSEIPNFEQSDNQNNLECKEKCHKKNHKRKHSVAEVVDPTIENDNKDEEDCKPKRKKLKSDTEESEISPSEGENENDETAKQKKKRKKKKKIKKEKSSATTLGLKVLTKREWKVLRNKYLNMQRDMMRSLKQQLMHSKWDKNKPVGLENEEVSSKQTPKFKPEPGIVVKVTLEQPISSQTAANAKTEMRIHPDIRYVDVTEGSPVVYLRAATPQLAASLVQSHHWTTMEIIQGDEEKQYWNKMNSDREERLKKNKSTNQRGRTKLLKRAERFQSKHITTFEPS